jgi:hypothetical protein
VAIEGSWIGMDVTELSPGDASALGLPGSTKGILVNDVESPPATMVGFQTGDVIVAVNGQPTPDIKRFKAATRQQSGAVVDTIRGNRHLLISVPPPGFTAHGTKLNTGLNNKMRQVAMARPPGGRLGILSSGPDLYSQVTGDTNHHLYLIVVDFNSQAWAAVGLADPNHLPEVFQQYGIRGLVCGDISGDTSAALAPGGVMIYSGMTGRAIDAVGLYEENKLVAMNRH